MANRRKPSIDRAVQMNICMTHDLYDSLHEHADLMGVSVSALARGLLQDGLYNKLKPADASGEVSPVVVVQQRALSLTNEETCRQYGTSKNAMLLDDLADAKERMKEPALPWYETSTLLSEEDKQVIRDSVAHPIIPKS